jgi:hypothetical protein
MMAIGLGLVAWGRRDALVGRAVHVALHTPRSDRRSQKELQGLDRKWSGRVRLSSAFRRDGRRRRVAAGSGCRRALRVRAAAFRQNASRRSRVSGRIIVPRLGLNMVVIEGNVGGRPPKGPGTTTPVGPAHVRAWDGRRDRRRGPPHDVPSSVPAHRRPPARRRHHAGDALRARSANRVYYHLASSERGSGGSCAAGRSRSLVLTACHPLYSRRTGSWCTRA